MRACIPDRSDNVLLAGLATGDPQLSMAFVRRFQRTVFGIALGLARDPGLAEDIAQAAFERAWRSADSYDARRGSVRVWLARITHNLAVDAIRIRRPTPLDLTLELTEWNPYLVCSTEGPEQRALASETSNQLRDALADLPSEQARAVVLAAAYGMTAHEIADREHIPLGTAKSRIRAAMTKLHAAFAGQTMASGSAVGCTGEGSCEVPTRNSSTACATALPSAIAQTTSEAPRCASPQTNTPGDSVCQFGPQARLPRGVRRRPNPSSSAMSSTPANPIASSARSHGSSITSSDCGTTSRRPVAGSFSTRTLRSRTDLT
jgi:RNA polymerase sigma factor (sigma-70 family)